VPTWQSPRRLTPDIPLSDSERLIQASQILKACIVANDTSHSFDIDHSYPLEAVHSLVQDVIGHRGQAWAVIAQRGPPQLSAAARFPHRAMANVFQK